eukprot:1372675-Prymnesium_polylepis.1
MRGANETQISSHLPPPPSIHRQFVWSLVSRQVAERCNLAQKISKLARDSQFFGPDQYKVQLSKGVGGSGTE